MHSRFFVGAFAILISLAFGCGGGGAEGGTTPSENIANYQGPVTSTDVEAGKAAFEKACASCHPGGGSGLGPAITDLHAAPGLVRMQIREGQGKMPPIPPAQLTDTELEDMMAYLVTIGTVEGGGAGGAEPAEGGDMPEELGGEEEAL